MCTIIGMCGGLDASIQELELPELLSLIDRLNARASVLIAEFDEAERWSLAGATSMTAWLKAAGQTSRDARLASAIALKLRRLPVTGRAWIDGVLSGGQIQVIVANVTPAAVELFA